MNSLKIAEYKGIAIYAQLIELGKIIGKMRTSDRVWECYYCESFQDVFRQAKMYIDILDKRGTL